MPKSKSKQIEEILMKKQGYADISKEDLDYADEVEEKLATLNDKAARDAYYDTVKERYEQIKELKESETATDISELSHEESRANIRGAIDMLADMENEYEKINPVGRFFSHFVPNSWTKAGKMRNEMKECSDTMEKLGFNDKVIEDFYIEDWNKLGDGLRYAQVVAKAKQNHWFNRGVEKELRQYAADHMIAEPVDISLSNENSEESRGIEEDEEDREPFEIHEVDEVDDDMENDGPEESEKVNEVANRVDNEEPQP